MITRRKTRQITLGNLKVGGDAPLTVQSMTKTDTRDVQATLLEIWALEAAGCDVVRCAVPVREAAEKLGEIKRQIRIPLVADIHFNYKLALIALEQGVDGLRLNPGNIGGKKFVMEVVTLAKDRKIPIRIGVNAGSLEKDLLEKYGGPTAKGMVESALRHIHILEECAYPEMKVSLKASDPLMMIEAYRMLADQVDYAFHLGVTEAGTPGVGTIKSAVGLGALLSEGIGDTIRVSLSADPTEEVRVGIDILKSLGLRKGGLTFVSCPSCGRADVDLVKLAKEVEDEFRGLNEEIHIAVMGCEVNGPGEARAADIGVAGGRGIGLIFKGGEVIRKVPEKEIVTAMREEVDKFLSRAAGREGSGGSERLMGQYDCHVFVCTTGDDCPKDGDVEGFVKYLRGEIVKAGRQQQVRINKAGCFSQCGHGPMIVVYPENVWYGGVQQSDLEEIVQSHILGGTPVERLRYEPGVKGANKKKDAH